MQPSRKFAQVGLIAAIVILGMSMVTLVVAREAPVAEPGVSEPSEVMPQTTAPEAALPKATPSDAQQS